MAGKEETESDEQQGKAARLDSGNQVRRTVVIFDYVCLTLDYLFQRYL